MAITGNITGIAGSPSASGNLNANSRIILHDGVGSAISSGTRTMAYYDPYSCKYYPLHSAGGGAASIRFKVLSVGPSLGSQVDDCDYVVAEVLGVSCSSSNVSVGDEVYVWDPSYCHFNLPISVLVGARGTATSMTNDLNGVIACLDARLGTCRWVVHSLCCTEEICG